MTDVPDNASTTFAAEGGLVVLRITPMDGQPVVTLRLSPKTASSFVHAIASCMNQILESQKKEAAGG